MPQATIAAKAGPTNAAGRAGYATAKPLKDEVVRMRVPAEQKQALIEAAASEGRV